MSTNASENAGASEHAKISDTSVKARSDHALILKSLRFSELEQAAQDELRTLLSTRIIAAIDRSIPVYLEGFGILFPITENRERNEVVQNKVVIRSEVIRSIKFEKCGELVAFHKERYGGMVELPQLAREISEQGFTYQTERRGEAPMSSATEGASNSGEIRGLGSAGTAASRNGFQKLGRHFNDRDCRRLIRELLQTLKRTVVQTGRSIDLPLIGTWYALHNRQGTSFNDWFAGADIFLKPTYQQTIISKGSRIIERPILENALEILKAMFGKPVKILSVDLVRELSSLGFDANTLVSSLDPTQRRISVAVFKDNQGTGNLIYCTEGLRFLGLKLSNQQRPGSEYVFQLDCNSPNTPSSEDDSIPLWPLRALAMGWVLLQSAKSKTVGFGAGLCSDSPLIQSGSRSLSAIFTVPFRRSKLEQLSRDGPFYYVNLVALAENEARLAENCSAEHLSALLEHKDLDQLTRPGRMPLTYKASIGEIAIS